MQETHSNTFFTNNPQKELNDSIRPIIITDNFSTPENIGHIIRLAANVGTLKVIILGSENMRKSKIKKTAGAAFDHIQLIFSDTERLNELIPNDYSLTALETVNGAKSIFSTKLPDKMALILGNEKYGISNELLNMSRLKVFIPMPGTIRSMNVSHAAAVCLFQWYSQHH